MSKNLCGPKVKHFRLEQNLTLTDLAAKLKIEHKITLDRTNIGRIENNQRALADYELVALANILDVSLAQLLPPNCVKKANA
jgi:transcriptional regulator with XRE-family HTH domain